VATLAINGQNVGKDATVTIRASTGETYAAEQLGLLTDVKVSFKNSDIETKTIVGGGRTFYEVIPHGLTLSLSFARYNGNLTNLMTSYRINWFNGVRMYFTLQIQIRNPDGSVNTYTFTQCKPTRGSLGDFKPDAAVIQTLDFECQDVTDNSGTLGLFSTPTS
jgi:hypothetical protein